LFASSWYIFLTYIYDAQSHLHKKFDMLGGYSYGVLYSVTLALTQRRAQDTMGTSAFTAGGLTETPKWIYSK